MRKTLAASITAIAIAVSGASATHAAQAAPTTQVPVAVTIGATAPVSFAVVKGAASALTVLDQLQVKGKAPGTGYERSEFGTAWKDVDRNGCDTRNDILRRDLKGIRVKAKTRGCVVAKGTLTSPYTGAKISFVRGPNSAKVQIDHVVPLKAAWLTGAQQWSAKKRTKFANDPINLLAVDGRSNAQKGAGDAATWLPKRKAYRCTYVARQVSVKAKYGLWVTSAEKAAIERVLSTCSSTKTVKADPAPKLSSKTPVATTTPSKPKPKPVTQPKPKPKPKPSSSAPRFGTCAEAKKAGYGPFYRGDVEYSWYQDRDGDGVVCE